MWNNADELRHQALYSSTPASVADWLLPSRDICESPRGWVINQSASLGLTLPGQISGTQRRLN